MEPFLQSLATHLHNTYGDDIQHIAVVLPSKRGKLFFKTYLAKQMSRPTWSPALYSIDEFTEELSGLAKAEPLNLMLELYQVYLELKREEIDFKEFCSWGSVMLQDINEIDSYLVNANELFAYLSESRAIQLWNPGGEELTEFQQKYLEFWNSLESYHTAFREKLLQKKTGYPGLIFRKASENIYAVIEEKEWKKVIFAGFNAITPAEEKIILALKELGKCETCWDADSYYVDDKWNEAGKFLRQAFSKGLNTAEREKWLTHSLSLEKKNVRILTSSQNTAQPRIAGELLTSILNDSNQADTGVVLGDETLLLPMLENLPAAVKAVNITMGYPFKASPVYNFISNIIELHVSSQQLKEKELKKEVLFYFRYIRELLANPVISFLITKKERKDIATLLGGFVKNSRIFIRPSELSSLPENVRILFKPSADLKEILESMCTAFETAITKVNEEKTINGEFVLAGYKLLRKVSDFLSSAEVGIDGLLYLFQTLASSHTIPFFGEPVRGLQLMGILETRTLDFKNIILLSANEGILPSSSRQNSFVPIEIKKLFGLPTYADRDAVFAYHFYRMIQRAENVWIIYSSSVSENGPGEKSRFVKQIQYELPKKNSQATITEVSVSGSHHTQEPELISIEKNEEIITSLKKKLQSGISPSALNTFKDCNYRFYLKYVASIEEPQTSEDTIDAATFGQLVHKTLENFYTPFIGKAVTAKDVREMIRQSAAACERAFLEKIPKEELFQGKNLLAFRVANRFVSNYLENELGFLEKHGAVIIKGLEERLSAVVRINGLDVTVSGYADRIDEHQNTIRIIDYKTGSVKPSDLALKDVNDLIEKAGQGKPLQLLLYAWLLSQDERFKGKALQSGIFALKRSSTGLNKLEVKGEDVIGEPVLQEFQKVLETMITEILDPSKKIEQTQDTRICGYCGYAGICGR